MPRDVLNRNQILQLATIVRKIAVTLLLSLSIAACGTSKILINDSAAPIYYGTIENIDKVYDGDTIQDVSIRIYPFNNFIPNVSEMPLTIWPGVERRQDGIYSLIDIRISGIDAPEKRPVRGDRSEESIQREKARAEAATNFLKQLILENTKEDGELGFYIQNPEFGTYAGRIVADIFFFNDGISINVADEMIDNGHAVAYSGGTKTHDWGAE